LGAHGKEGNTTLTEAKKDINLLLEVEERVIFDICAGGWDQSVTESISSFHCNVGSLFLG